MSIKAELISIGDELLIGLKENSHLVTIGDQLNRFGLRLQQAREIRDSGREIEAALKQSWENSNLILTTGGLGPTADDMTVEHVAQALNVDSYFDKEVEAKIKDFFERRGLIPTKNNFKQCQVLTGSEVLHNANGSAPGQWFEKEGKVLVMLPGPTCEMVPILQEQVIPKLIEKGWASEKEPFLQLRTMGVGESKVAELIEPVVEPHSDYLNIAYCAHSGLVDVRLSDVGDGLSQCELRQLGEKCKDVLGDGFVGYGEINVACLLLRQLRNMGKSLAVAESCTGGLLSDRFTDIPGASTVFKGGIVSYTNDVKENLLGIPPCLLKQHGAVSAECAAAMAAGVAEALESDYALSITGFAGPDGGKEPAGTVYLGYYSPVGVWSRRFKLPGGRKMVKERAVNQSLDFMRRKLIKYEVHDLLESLKC